MEAWRLRPRLRRRVPPTVGGGRVLPTDSSPLPPPPVTAVGSRGGGSCRRPAGPWPGYCAPTTTRALSSWSSSTWSVCSDTRSLLGCRIDSVLPQVPVCPEPKDTSAFQNFSQGSGADSRWRLCEPSSVSSAELFRENWSWESSHHLQHDQLGHLAKQI